MLMDQNHRFSQAQAITATAVSAFYYDQLTGSLIATGSGYVANTSYELGNATLFGEDSGIGISMMAPPRVVVTSLAGTPAAATSLTIAIQGAPDVSATLTYAGLTFVTYEATGAIPLAAILGSSRLASLWLPKRQVGAAMPRFYQLNYIVGGSNFTGLTVNADITTGADDAIGTLGLYPAGY